MALSPQALLKGLVSALLPAPNPDSANNDVALRLARYGEQVVMPQVRKSHLLADEGTYFVANNAQTGVAMTTTLAFSATAPFILIVNQNPIGGRSIYLDTVKLITTAAGSAASGLTLIQGAVVIDNGNRYSSGGTQITAINSPNMNIANAKSGALIYYGALTATAATAAARNVVGLITYRPTVSATVADVIGENKIINFGGVEGGSAGTITVANANIIPIAVPPCIIGPQQSGLIYVFYAAGGTPVAASYAAEIGFWER